ncbi:MAG: hypothetical protein GF416_08970 [Candidatus Altiarchaeales archaeon]|nr:hypothetical protein [Candidatus Altiarchaeales archaeon]MBD3417249.1 hypothetical protein [Candidatus Altiarchaeales archaeon]
MTLINCVSLFHRSWGDLGFYDYGARQYNPTLRRFMQPDSIIPDYYNPQSLNRYSYTLNNPLKYIDPDGHLGVEYSSSSSIGTFPIPIPSISISHGIGHTIDFSTGDTDQGVNLAISTGDTTLSVSVTFSISVFPNYQEMGDFSGETSETGGEVQIFGISSLLSVGKQDIYSREGQETNINDKIGDRYTLSIGKAPFRASGDYMHVDTTSIEVMPDDSESLIDVHRTDNKGNSGTDSETHTESGLIKTKTG